MDTRKKVKADGRAKRIGGSKECEECGKPYEAFRPWDKYCSNKCGSVVRMVRYWAKKIEARKR